MNSKTLFAQAKKLFTSLDGTRWQLAELAYDASQSAGLDTRWDLVIARACRVDASTVRGWKRGYEWWSMIAVMPFHKSAIRDKLAFSFFSACAGKADVLTTDKMVELLEAYAAEDGRGIHEFRAQLSELAGRSTDADVGTDDNAGGSLLDIQQGPFPAWRQELDQEITRLERIAAYADTPPLIGLAIRTLLNTVREWVTA